MKTKDRFNLKTALATLSGLREKAEDIQEKCSDFTVSDFTKNMRFNGSVFDYRPEQYDAALTARELTVGPVAFNQICTRFGLPASYMTKCLETGQTDLFEKNMNAWIDREPEDSRALVREYDGEIRGFLSTRYTPCDAPDVIQALEENIDSDEFMIKGYFLDETRLHIRMIKKEKLNVNGEDLFAGLSITSSDVGISALSISFFVYKQVCSNGLVISKLGGNILKLRHIGIDLEEFKNATKEAVEKFDVICENITAVIEQKSKEFLQDADIEHLITKIAKEAQVSKKEQAKIVELAKTRYISKDGKVSVWGVINGITEVAQGYDIDRRLELETYAGKLLAA